MSAVELQSGKKSVPRSTLLAVVLLGLLAKVSTPEEIARWTKRHFSKLSKVLRFGRIKVPMAE